MDSFLDPLGSVLRVQSFVEVSQLKEATEYLLKKYPLESPSVETLIVVMENIIGTDLKHPVKITVEEMWEDGAESSWEWSYEAV